MKEFSLPNKFLTKAIIENDLRKLLTNNSVEIVKLDNNNLSGELCQTLMTVLRTNTSIKTLSLKNTNLDNVDISLLAHGCKGHPTLKAIYLDNNNFNDDGFASLISVFKALSLEKLCISFNKALTSKSAMRLVDYLSASSSIKAIYLSACSFEAAEIKMLAEKCATHPSLQTISLRLLGLGDEDISSFERAIQINNKIIDIDIEMNPRISSACKQRIEKLLDKNLALYPIKQYEKKMSNTRNFSPQFPSLQSLTVTYIKHNILSFNKENMKNALSDDVFKAYFEEPSNGLAL